MKENIIGNMYGRWKVLDKVYRKEHRKWYYKCECQCFFKTVSIINKNDLVKGKTVKCKHCSSNKFIEHDDYYEGITKKGESFFFDKDDYDIAISNTWSINNRGYVVARKHGKNRRFHREVMKKYYEIELQRSEYIDHINRKRHDNRMINLRLCDSSVNQENRKIQKNTTGHKGIRLMDNGKYQVRICKNYKEYCLGTFGTLEEAIQARKEGERKYHNETFRIMEVMPDFELEEVEYFGNADRGSFGSTGKTKLNK